MAKHKSKKNTKRRCELLTIYDSNEYDKLLLLPNINIKQLEKHKNTFHDVQSTDFVFSNEECMHEKEDEDEKEHENTECIREEINIDDI